MKRHLTTLLCLTLLTTAPAAEIYFDTVSTATASRLHGAYFGTYAGGVDANGATTSRRLRNLDVDGNGTGWMVGVEFGYKWATPVGLNLAAELELYYLNQDMAGSDGSERYRSSLHAFGAMANGIVQIDFESLLGEDAGWITRIKPYFGAGVGFGYGYQNQVAYKRAGERERELGNAGSSSFGYQLLAGVEVEMAENFSVYGEYRYLNLYDFGAGEIEGVDFSAWVLGVRFQY
jgi:outer membrane autotransporter protein